MSREWKPGDVAMVRNEYKVWNVAICTLRADRHGYWWRYGVADSWSPIVADARPLVVIDPEDQAFTDLLADILERHNWQPRHRSGLVDSGEDLAAALREFANPTSAKPDEPTGLGAVVEAANGELWVRVGGQYEWEHAATDEAGNHFVDFVDSCHYADIAAVRVLSEGVTP